MSTAFEAPAPALDIPAPALDVNRAAMLFALAGDGTRLRLLILLDAAAGDRSVGELCVSLDVRQTTLSHHLSLLRISGLLSCQCVGKGKRYTIEAPGRALVALARGL